MNRSTKQNYVRCRVCVLTWTFALGCMENLGSTRDNNKHETHGWVNLASSPLPHAVIGGGLGPQCFAVPIRYSWGPRTSLGLTMSEFVGTKEILGAHHVQMSEYKCCKQCNH